MKIKLQHLFVGLLSMTLLLTTTSCGNDDDVTPNTNNPSNPNAPDPNDYGKLGKGDFTATGSFKDLKPFTATILCSINQTYAGTYMDMGVEIVPKSPHFNSDKCERISGSGVTGGKYEVYLMDGDRGMLDANTTYYYRSYANMAGIIYYGATRSLTTPNPTIITTGSVDLGLSCKWAACNLGASAPEMEGKACPLWEYSGPWENNYYSNRYGNCYFTFPHRDAWNNYWSGDANWDIATKTLGVNWHTPSINEWYELLNNCHWVYMRYKGTQGYAVANGDGTKAIFIPLYNTTDRKLPNTFPQSACPYITSDVDIVNELNSLFAISKARAKDDNTVNDVVSDYINHHWAFFELMQLNKSGLVSECRTERYEYYASSTVTGSPDTHLDVTFSDRFELALRPVCK